MLLQGPSVGRPASPFPGYPTGPLSLLRRPPSPPALFLKRKKKKGKEKKKPFLILGSRTRSSLFLQLLPSCALNTKKPSASSAITTERNLIYFGRFICAFTLGLSLTHLNNPLQDSLPSRSGPFSMPPAPTHSPSIPTLILFMISFLALLEMDHSTQTVLIRRIALLCLGPLGLPTLQCKHLLQGFNLDI